MSKAQATARSFEDLGSVRHALSNGRIASVTDLTRWNAVDLIRQLGVRPHELRQIEAFLAEQGLGLSAR